MDEKSFEKVHRIFSEVNQTLSSVKVTFTPNQNYGIIFICGKRIVLQGDNTSPEEKSEKLAASLLMQSGNNRVI